MQDAVVAWVDAYVRAWRSNEPDAIGALFTDDATYLASPSSDPAVGREAIVAWWLEHADGPDDATFTYEVIGVDGLRAFVRGITKYRATGDQPERTYDNLWVIDLADDGRAGAFTEWYARRHG
jgi:uncharacterized protein (TIGR02246 family)